MKNRIFFLLICLLLSISLFAQNNPMEKFNPLVGKWGGTGAGFGSTKSVVQSEFYLVMNKTFIEVKNHAVFKPTTQQPNGEIHDDWGMISYDNARKKYIFRQFHSEGFINQYILNDSISTDKIFVFESENIENFVPGGNARFTIKIINKSEIETLFDVGFPGKEMACFGSNQLKRK